MKKIKISNRFKNILKVSSGTLGGQLITIISMPIFTRIYGAEIIGEWAFLNAIFLVINSISDLGLSQAIMIEEDNRDIDEKIYRVVSSTSLIISILTGIVLGVISLTRASEISFSLIFLLIYTILATFVLKQVQICYTWINKKSNYNVLMKNPIVSNISFVFFGIVLFFLGFGQYGYFAGWLMGQILTIFYMRKHLPRKFITININDYKSIFLKYRHFIKYQMPTNVLGQVQNQIPVFFIRTFFGSVILGFYSISLKLLNIPIGLLGNAIGRVFFQEASKLHLNGNNIGAYTYQSMKFMMKISIIPMLFLIAIGDYVVVAFLGSDWEGIGLILAITSFQVQLGLLSASISGITAILKKQRLRMITTILEIISISIIFYIANFLNLTIYTTLILKVIIVYLLNTFFFAEIYKSLEISRKKFLYIWFGSYLIILLGSFLLRRILFLLIMFMVN